MLNKIQRFALFATIIGAGIVESRYNILSIDSAKYKGFMTASFIGYMEKYAYQTAVRDYCLPPRASEKIAMPELFDLLAGSETGAIIATSLVLPNSDATQLKGGQKNQYFAETSMNWFWNQMDVLYHNSSKAVGFMQFIFLLITIGLSYLAYHLVDKSFEETEYEEVLTRLSFILKVEKKIAKGQPYDREVSENKYKRAVEDIKEHNGPYYNEIKNCFAEVQVIRANPTHGDKYNGSNVDIIRKLQHAVKDIRYQISRHEGYKYPAGFFSFIILYPLLVIYAAPGLAFLLWSLRDATDLYNALVISSQSEVGIIPENANITDIVSDDLLLTSWDLNNRRPRWFNQWSTLNEKTVSKMNLAQMTWASAVTPYYFKPATINDNLYISGDNIAKSPALFSYMYANEKLGKTNEDIRVVAIGSTDELPDFIGPHTSLIDWIQRLTTLNSESKEHTQDYMLNAIMGRKGHSLHKFNIKTSRAWEEELYTTWHRHTEIGEQAQNMINENKEEIHRVINQLVAEKFGIYHSCYTNFCGSEFPEFTLANPDNNNNIRFTNSNTDTYLAAAPAAKKTYDGWDCTLDDKQYGRTCTAQTVTPAANGKPAVTRNRFQGTVESTQTWCRENPADKTIVL